MMLLLLLLLPAAAPLELATKLCPSLWDVEACESACAAGDGAACEDAAKHWERADDRWLLLLKRAKLLRAGCDAGRTSSCSALAEVYEQNRAPARAVAVLAPLCRTTREPECGALYALVKAGVEPDQPAERARLLALLEKECATRADACFAASYLHAEGSAHDDEFARKAGALLEKACLANDVADCERLARLWWQGAGESQLERWRRVAAKGLVAGCRKKTPDCRVAGFEGAPPSKARSQLLTELCRAGRAASCAIVDDEKLVAAIEAEAARCRDEDLAGCRLLARRERASDAARKNAEAALCDAGEADACRRFFSWEVRGDVDRYDVARLCRAKIAIACRIEGLWETVPDRLDAATRKIPGDARSVGAWRVKTVAAGTTSLRGPVLLLTWTWRGDDRVDSAVVRATAGDTSIAGALLPGLKLGERARAWGKDAKGADVVVEVVVLEAD